MWIFIKNGFSALGCYYWFLLLCICSLKLRALWFPVMKIFAVVLTPFVIAAFITYLLHPIVEKLYENNLPRWLSILIIYLLFFGGIGFALYKGIPAFVVQLRDLVENVPQLTNQYREWISAVQVQTSTLPAGVQNMIDEGISAVEQKLNSLLDKVIGFFDGDFKFHCDDRYHSFYCFLFFKRHRTVKKGGMVFNPREMAGKRNPFFS